MNGASKLSPEIATDESRNVNLLHRSSSSMDVAPNGDNDDLAPAQPVNGHEVVEMQHSNQACPHGQEHGQHEMMQSIPGPSEAEHCNINEESRTSPANFLTYPLSFFWRRLKWGLILSLGRNDCFFRMNKEDMKAAVAAQLEVAIMGSALVLTLCLQIQEVVGSRGGFTLPERESARFVFVSSSALSFSFAFYSIITSAMILLSINAVPQDSAESFLKTLSSWSAIPRLCTLTGAFCLGIAALTAFFLGLEHATAWVGVAVMATALLLTIASTITILIRVKRLQAKVWEEVHDCTSVDCTESRPNTEHNHVFQRKFRDVSDPNLSSPAVQPVLTPLSSLTSTTGFSIRTSRFRQ